MWQKKNMLVFPIRFFRSQSTLTALIVVAVLASVFYEPFTTYRNICNILMQISYTGITAVGLTFVIISGGIDLSVGSTIVIAAILASRASIMGYPLAVSLILPLLAGLAVGLVNGLLVSYMEMPPFIATLASMLAVRGIAFLITLQSVDVIIKQEGSFRNIAIINILGLPLFSVLFLIAVVIGGAVLKYCRIGRWVYAIGGNEEAACMMGLKVRKVKLFAYGFCGLLAGLAGLLLASRTGLPQADACQGWEMDAIAAVVLGGTTLLGGRGKMSGTLFGALILGIVANIINLEPRLSTYLGNVVTGLILLVVVIIQSVTSKSR